MKLPTQEEIEAAILALQRAWSSHGYHRRLPDNLAAVMAWAAVVAVYINRVQLPAPPSNPMTLEREKE